MLASNDNKYGMYLTPEEMQNSLLMEQLRLQQEANIQQAKMQQKYTYGWVDPTTWHQPNVIFKEVEQDLNKVLWNIKPIPAHKWLAMFAGVLIVIGIVIKVLT